MSLALSHLKKLPKTRETIKNIPNESGVYIFWSHIKPVYIGKAINLKNRLTSYFAINLSEKTQKMVNQARYISIIPVSSEIEALLLEAELIWKFQPYYNFALKDDKHPLYIMITKEKYPRVLPVKRAQLDIPHRAVFGPFPSTANIKYVLKLLRPIFPFSNHVLGKKPCLYSQMGLCVPCPNEIEHSSDKYLQRIMIRKYEENIRNIKGILSGRIKKVRRGLEKEMRILAQVEKFEQAKIARSKIQRLDYITAPRLPLDKFVENPNLLTDIREAEVKEFKKLLEPYIKIKTLDRIECFDIAHFASANPTASMVTFIAGEPDKNYYRHFKVRQKKGGDDISSLQEIAIRRENRLNDWGRPDLIIVDGGKGQVKVFSEVFKDNNIPVVGIAKRFETIVLPWEKGYILLRPKSGALSLVQRIRNEAHRFARRYHHKLLKKSLLPN